jgi:hypothetical protein
LSEVVKMWPTPRANESTESVETQNARIARGTKASKNLTAEAKRAMWPTPCASDNRDRGHVGMPAIQRRVEIGKQIGLGQSVSETSVALNPDWVEWLMGWPIGWTDCEPLAMARFRAWLRSHGEFCKEKAE